MRQSQLCNYGMTYVVAIQYTCRDHYGDYDYLETIYTLTI